MGDGMIVITCIKPETIQKIHLRGEGTIELVSQQNVSAAEEIRTGDMVFLTCESEEDVGQGSEGIVIRVERVAVEFFRHNEPHADEWEIKRARIRGKFVSPARVHKMVRGKVTTAEVDSHDHLLIG